MVGRLDRPVGRLRQCPAGRRPMAAMQPVPARRGVMWSRCLLLSTRRRRYVHAVPARSLGHAVRVGLASCGAGAHGEHGLGTNAMVPSFSAVPLPEEAPNAAAPACGLPPPPTRLGCGLAHTVAPEGASRARTRSPQHAFTPASGRMRRSEWRGACVGPSRRRPPGERRRGGGGRVRARACVPHPRLERR